MYKKLLAIIFLYLFAANVFAGQDVGLGWVAKNLMSPIFLMLNFVYTGCWLIGSSFIFASLVKYFQYRSSPLMTPLSTVIFLLLAGVMLIVLPSLSHFAGSDTDFSLVNKSPY